MIESAEFYVQEIIDRSEAKDQTLIAILVISIVAMVTSILLLFPVIKKVNTSREEVLSLFLDIPKKTIKVLSNKCEKFLINLQDEGDAQSIDSEILSLDDDEDI